MWCRPSNGWKHPKVNLKRICNIVNNNGAPDCKLHQATTAIHYRTFHSRTSAASSTQSTRDSLARGRANDHNNVKFKTGSENDESVKNTVHL